MIPRPPLAYGHHPADPILAGRANLSHASTARLRAAANTPVLTHRQHAG